MVHFNHKTIQYFSEQCDLLTHYMKSVGKKPDVENVHKLRVTIRRIRSILQVTHNKNNKLKQLAKELGKVRDLDVAIINCQKFKLNPNPLKELRSTRLKKVHRLLEAEERKSIEKKVNFIRKRLQSASQFDIKLSISNIFDEFERLKKPTTLEEFHQIRIALKKVRYLFEANGKTTGALKKIQDQLGEVHDLEVLAQHYPKEPKITAAKQRKLRLVKPKIQPVVSQSLKRLNNL